MAINKNHEFEDLDGVKCAIVEKNVSKERTAFLKPLLEYNGYTVITQPSAAPKTAAVPDQAVVAEEPPAPETFTVGVTDVMFNAINAVFGRLLQTPGGHVVTLAYWRQQEEKANDEIPYFEKTF
jgi:hypothetical protein